MTEVAGEPSEQPGENMRVPKRVLSAAIAAVALTTGVVVASAPEASAAPDCAVAQAPVRVAQIGGTALEGLAVDASGRLYTTDIISGRVFRIDAPGGPAYEVARVPGGGGALAWAPDGTLLVGYGANPTVLIGDVVKAAGIVRLNVDTLETSTFATGLSAANGLAVADDGTVYATNDFGSLIGRIAPDGTVDAAWARFPSANGAVLDEAGQYLYVSRTFVNSGVTRIPTSNPSAPESILDLNGLDSLSAPDGLTLDSAGRPVVPFNTRGQIVRIDAPGSYCILGSGIPTSSVVIYGRGEQGFSAGRLFRAGFDGAVYEIPGGRDLN